MAGESIRAESSIVWFPKQGHQPNEYEDAFGLPAEKGFRIRAAIADGATESAFSREWARILVQQAVVDVDGGIEDIVRRSRSTFEEYTVPLLPDLAWYAQAKLEEGAYAAVMIVDWTADLRWRATAMGDCCLFHCRGATLLGSWPFESTSAFHNWPVLLSSVSEPFSQDWLTVSGWWQSGDRFLLTTDAAASWLLEHGVAQDMEGDVRAAQMSGSMRNDDITIMTIRLTS